MPENKRIIVEGMDGSGKTTLIQALIDRIPGLEVVRNEKGPEQNFNNWWYYQLARRTPWRTPIHDRFFYSELVYGPVLRGSVSARGDVIQQVQSILRTSALLIYARPDENQLRQGLSTNPQMEGVSDRFTQLLKLYDLTMDEEADWFGDRFVWYVWHRDNLELERVEGITRSYLAGAIR
jgi:thymidylate kinase